MGSEFQFQLCVYAFVEVYSSPQSPRWRPIHSNEFAHPAHMPKNSFWPMENHFPTKRRSCYKHNTFSYTWHGMKKQNNLYSFILCLLLCEVSTVSGAEQETCCRPIRSGLLSRVLQLPDCSIHIVVYIHDLFSAAVHLRWEKI